MSALSEIGKSLEASVRKNQKIQKILREECEKRFAGLEWDKKPEENEKLKQQAFRNYKKELLAASLAFVEIK